MQDFARVFLHTRFCRQLSKNNIARRPKHGIGYALVMEQRADENRRWELGVEKLF